MTTPTVADLVAVIRNALDFANRAAGEGIEIDGLSPEDFLMEYSDAIGDADWETIPDRIGKQITRALSPAATEPVAWVCWDLAFGCGAKNLTSDRHLVDARLSQPSNWKVEPLYAAPPSPVTVEAGRVDAVTTIPSLGFSRGSVVRAKGGGPNMLVVRGLEETTVVVVCEEDEGGTLHLRDPKTDTLELVARSATPAGEKRDG